MLSKVAKNQFKMYLDQDWIDRLTDAGAKYGRGSPQSVVEELINIYFPVWASVNTAMQKAVDQQSRAGIPQGARVLDIDVGDTSKGVKKTKTG